MSIFVESVLPEVRVTFNEITVIDAAMLSTSSKRGNVNYRDKGRRRREERGRGCSEVAS